MDIGSILRQLQSELIQAARSAVQPPGYNRDVEAAISKCVDAALRKWVPTPEIEDLSVTSDGQSGTEGLYTTEQSAVLDFDDLLNFETSPSMNFSYATISPVAYTPAIAAEPFEALNISSELPSTSSGVLSMSSQVHGGLYNDIDYPCTDHATSADQHVRPSLGSGTAARSHRHFIPEETWTSMHDVLENLYIKQKRPLKQVSLHMEKNYGFIATTKQYRYQFQKWEWKKYNVPHHSVER